MTAPPLPTFVPQDAWYTITTGNVNPSVADPVPNVSYLQPISTVSGLVDGLVGPLDGAVIMLAGLSLEYDGGQKWLMWIEGSLIADDGVNTFCPFVDESTPGRWRNIGAPVQGPGIVVSNQSFNAGESSTIFASVAPFINCFVIQRTANAVTTLALPAATFYGQTVMVKDAVGDATTWPITITAASIDGATTFVLGTDYQEIKFVWNGLGWSVA